MGFSIGPISLTYLEAHSWDVRRQVETVNIPFARQTGYTVGAELVAYQLTGAFHADTDAEAKVVRRQLNELFNNPDIDFEYIEFDLDDEELSGWFLLDSINTQIIPGVFGNYPFSCNVRRLGNKDSLKISGYWVSNELTNDYGLSARTWLALPYDFGGSALSQRAGESGGNKILTSPTANPIVYTGDMDISEYYEMRCRVSRDSAFVPDSSTWVEIYGKDHVLATGSEEYFFSNGLIGISSHTASGIKILQLLYYDTSLAVWLKQITRIYFRDSGGSNYTVIHRSILEKYSYDEIIWSILLGSTNDNSTFPVKFKLRRGTYFVDIEIPQRQTGNDIGPNTALVSNVTFSSSTSSANYFSGIHAGCYAGFLFTENASPSISSTEVRLGYTISANDTSKFAIFLLPNPLPSGVTLANLGTEYIANMTQQTVLVDTKWL